MERMELGKDWQLREEALACGRDQHAVVLGRETGWLPVPALPCDVHVPLIEAGLIENPVVADHHLRCQWIEDRSWWFRRTFSAAGELLAADNSELVIDGLDAHADLFLNGTHLGHHRSAFYPFRRDVRDLLRAGENILLVRLTSGLEYYSDRDLAAIKDFISCEYKRGRAPRGDNRRVFVRKPQYVYGWDWTPRIATCGIMGGARIEACKDIAIRYAKFTTLGLTADAARVRVEVEIDNLAPVNTVDAAVRVDICLGEAAVAGGEQDAFLRSGINHLAFDFDIARPALWWPNGMGAQSLYDVTVGAVTAKGATDEHRFRTGIRTVRLNTERVDGGGRLFAFEINGVRMFCKGANWETPDALYGRVTDSQVERLVEEARDAHFNMLRFNGVNGYGSDRFYECCDRHGILVWQDFAFSCAAYPDELDWFRGEAEQEVEHQTRRLGNHPCIALWCGNNECQGLLLTYQKQGYWAGDRKPASPAGMRLYNEMMPRIVRRNAPDIPYWNSSSYGGEGDVESQACGDIHFYPFMDEDIAKRIDPAPYDAVAGKFVSEFGCPGPTRKSSLRRYAGGTIPAMDGAIWKLHTNTFEKGALKEAIRKHYADPEGLSPDAYLLYGGLFQGLMLGYAFEAMRCAPNNNGALFWSFNDAWGEIGWSIVDHYLTRKIAYYFVKRALQPRKLVLRHKDGVIAVSCLNDTAETLDLTLEYGYVAFDGRTRDVAERRVTVPSFGRSVPAVRFPVGAHDPLAGVYYARARHADAGLIPATLRLADARALALPRTALAVSAVQEDAGALSFTVSSDTYAHAVHFDLNDRVRLSDAYFDLLPGEKRRVTLAAEGMDLSGGAIVARSVTAGGSSP